MGQGPDVVFPSSLTDNGLSTAPYGSIIATLTEVPYSFGFWAYYEIVSARVLTAASLVNPAGNIVTPSKESVIAAAEGSKSDVGDIYLGMKNVSLGI